MAVDGSWVVQSNHTNSQPRCNTAAEAQLLIVATAGLLVADTATEEADIDHLLVTRVVRRVPAGQIPAHRTHKSVEDVLNEPPGDKDTIAAMIALVKTIKTREDQ